MVYHYQWWRHALLGVTYRTLAHIVLCTIRHYCHHHYHYPIHLWCIVHHLSLVVEASPHHHHHNHQQWYHHHHRHHHHIHHHQYQLHYHHLNHIQRIIHYLCTMPSISKSWQYPSPSSCLPFIMMLDRGLYKGKFPLYLHKSRGWWLSNILLSFPSIYIAHVCVSYIGARMRALWSCIGSVTAVGLAYYVITHIEEVPITGRKRFVPLRYNHHHHVMVANDL